jgi:hypothetical protein
VHALGGGGSDALALVGVVDFRATEAQMPSLAPVAQL